MKLVEWLDKAKDAVLGIGVVTVGSEFFMNVLQALSDGKITNAEFQHLLQSAEGWEFLAVVGLFVVTKLLPKKS
jgi:hypothetical protein